MSRKAVHYGAGNIGRGFIGQLLSQAGYEVCFIDVNDQLVEELRRRETYSVTLANEDHYTEWIRRVTAIHGNHTQEVADAIAEAELITTAIGVSALPYIASSLAAGIRLRLARGGPPLCVIACENTIGGSSQLKRHVYDKLSEEEKQQAQQLISFPDAAVDRIVPMQQHDDLLQVTVEPFFEWVVDRSMMREDLPLVAGIHYVDRLEPYISRKLFTVNTGHCSAAYFGYLKGYSTIQEVMDDKALRVKVYNTIAETGAMLCSIYGFDQTEHELYMQTIMDRFANPYLPDEVTRVGRSPVRKLSHNDRLVKPLVMAYERGLPVDCLLDAIIAALQFDYEQDLDAAVLQQALRTEGIDAVIRTYLGFADDHPLHVRLAQLYEQIGG
jgi:mannitol-1-phosphate 5-dehydrogenase